MRLAGNDDVSIDQISNIEMEESIIKCREVFPIKKKYKVDDI